MARVATACPGDGIGDCRCAVEGGDGEAGGVEAIVRQHGGRPFPALIAARANGIEGDAEDAGTRSLHIGLRLPRHRGERRRAARADVQHSPPAGVPERRVVALDVGVQRKGDEGPGDLVDRERRRGRPARLGARIVVLPERLVVRMEAPIEPGEARDDGILVQQHRVASHEVPRKTFCPTSTASL